MKNSYKIKQVIVVRKDLCMRKGKIAAQIAHAAMSFLLDGYTEGSVCYTPTENEKVWLSDSFAKIVLYVNSEAELLELVDKAKASDVKAYPIIDSGATEFRNIPTLTCAAFGPDVSETLDQITGHLNLL